MNIKQAIDNIDKAIKHLEKKKQELISTIKCTHGTYTNELFNTRGCKTCGSPKVVICKHELVIGKKRKSTLCNAKSCKYFKSS